MHRLQSINSALQLKIFLRQLSLQIKEISIYREAKQASTHLLLGIAQGLLDQLLSALRKRAELVTKVRDRALNRLERIAEIKRRHLRLSCDEDR